MLETNAGYYHFVNTGFPGTFSLAAGLGFPKDIDPNVALYGQRYAGQHNDTTTFSTRLRHDFGADWHLVVGVGAQIADRETTQVSNTITSAAGAYTSTIQTSTASRFTVLSNQAYLNGRFTTGGVSHALALGTTGFLWKNFNPLTGRTYTLGSASLSNPKAFPEPVFPDFRDRYRTSRAWQQVIVASDHVDLGAGIGAGSPAAIAG